MAMATARECIQATAGVHCRCRAGARGASHRPQLTATPSPCRPPHPLAQPCSQVCGGHHHMRPAAARRWWPTAIEHPHQPPPASSGRHHRHTRSHDATEAHTPALCAARMRPGSVGVPGAALHPLACPLPPLVRGATRHRRAHPPATHRRHPHHPYCAHVRTPLVDPPHTPLSLRCAPSKRSPYQWHGAHEQIPWLPGRLLSARGTNG